MAYFCFGGGLNSHAARNAATGTRRARGHVAIHSFGSSSTKAGTKAPHIPTSDDFLSLAVAGTGQRFPFVNRIVTVPQDVFLLDADGGAVV